MRALLQPHVCPSELILVSAQHDEVVGSAEPELALRAIRPIAVGRSEWIRGSGDACGVAPRRIDQGIDLCDGDGRKQRQ